MDPQIPLPGDLEPKHDVFYVRCRPQIKAAVLAQMKKDGFTSMSDWFDQFVTKAFSKPKISKRKK